ncbi:uncharacterized protein LOC127876599 isoform X2 [Dreissena polymorpha]|uniref:uncharacterized protein LOC127876599 isoform X2 n=1 Tax=Dreissena polymorpha TaxID=45954 RepID=UPI0022640B5E|nr:uncharacterized protein LOC127876599 isoform X2 [Dreissena polymorpha]
MEGRRLLENVSSPRTDYLAMAAQPGNAPQLRSDSSVDPSADGENPSSSGMVPIGVSPPDYAAVIRDQNQFGVAGVQESAAVNQADVQVWTEEAGDSILTTEEIEMIMQMRDARGDYLDSNASPCYDESIEMIEKSPEERKDAADGFTDLQTMEYNGQGTTSLNEAVADEETGRAASQEISFDNECTSCGPLNGAVTSFRRFLARQPPKKIFLYGVLVTVILGILLLVSLLPASIVYVDYHQIALKQNKITNIVDSDSVYYGGCYVLGPTTKFIYFDASTHDVVQEFDVFTLDTISVKITFSMHYFLRPREVGKLFRLFHMDYEDVIKKMALSVLRNLASTEITVDNFRFDRSYVETLMHAAVRDKLGGTCCPDCCTSRDCQSNDYCSTCSSAPTCHQGYHIDVRYFNLLSVKIPNAVFEKYLHATILKVQTEREDFIQEHAVTVKETEQQTKNITNRAAEQVEAGQATAYKIAMMANAQSERTRQLGLIQALNQMYTRLNVTQLDRKLSLMMVRELEANVDNLYSGYGYDSHTLYAGPRK